MKKLTATKIIVIAAVVIFLAALVYRHFSVRDKLPFDLAVAAQRDIVQEVTVTGNVKPAHNVDLAFEKSGRVSKVYADVGEKVSAGQALVVLDASELLTQLDKAQADLQTQKSDLNKAVVDLNNYYNNVPDTLNSAYTSANDAVRVQISNFFTNAETNPQLTFTSSNSNDKNNAEYQRLALSAKLSSWLGAISQLNQTTPHGDLENALRNADGTLTLIRSFLDLLTNVVINATNLSSSTTNSYTTSVSSARSEINSALSSVDGLSQTITTQKATITSKEDGLKSYVANIENIKAQINKTVLYSPMSGVVTKQDAKVGEIVGANSPVTSLISTNRYELEAFIPEVDIAKVKIGNRTDVTLDAYGNDVVFGAVVTAIDPAETMIEGVATYRTKFQFTKDDSRVKPGMTANIDVISGTHKNVIAVPARAVVNRNTSSTVIIYNRKTNSTSSRDVVTGLKGFDGYVEIVSGLNKGEEVVIPRLSS